MAGFVDVDVDVWLFNVITDQVAICVTSSGGEVVMLIYDGLNIRYISLKLVLFKMFTSRITTVLIPSKYSAQLKV
jgi:hypothetical protein